MPKRRPRTRKTTLVSLASKAPMLHIASIELRPNDLASRRSCVGLTTFLQISNELAALARGLITHVLKKELYDSRNREVVQWPKGLRIHPAG